MTKKIFQALAFLFLTFSMIAFALSGQFFIDLKYLQVANEILALGLKVSALEYAVNGLELLLASGVSLVISKKGWNFQKKGVLAG